MTSPVTIYRPPVTQVVFGGEAVTVMFGPLAGGVITNPRSAADQGLVQTEVLFVDVSGTAGLAETSTTVPIQPGATFVVIPGQTTNVSVNARSSGHKFSAIIFQAPTPFPPTPQHGTFPPAGPTTLTAIIPSYLYKQYDDDDDLLSFVGGWNALAQGYVDWFANVLLPVYTSPAITGSLLDWVAEGLYGMKRPTLSSGRNRTIGLLNTYAYNTLPMNVRRLIGAKDVTVTSDDVFKRIMTWNFYKGDGNVFNIRWLKRRIMRFLTVPNGGSGNIDQTYPVSVTTAPGAIAIRIDVGTRVITGGALYNKIGFNRLPMNSLLTQFVPGLNPLPLEPVLKEAIESGVLTLPFQYDFSVTISGD